MFFFLSVSCFVAWARAGAKSKAKAKAKPKAVAAVLKRPAAARRGVMILVALNLAFHYVQQQRVDLRVPISCVLCFAFCSC